MRLRLSVSLFCFVLAGCAHKSGQGLNYTIPRLTCQARDVQLRDCDSANPPHCKKIAVDYKAYCLQIQVKPESN